MVSRALINGWPLVPTSTTPDTGGGWRATEAALRDQYATAELLGTPHTLAAMVSPPTITNTASSTAPAGMAVSYTFVGGSPVPAYRGGGIEVLATNYRRFPVSTLSPASILYGPWETAVRSSSARVAFFLSAGNYRFKVRTPGGEERYASKSVTVAAGNTWIIVDHGGIADRITTVESQDNATFRAVNVDTGQTATNPNDDTGICLWLGDSLTVASPGPTTRSDGLASCASELLGYRNHWNSGNGGTGYIADNGGTRYKLIDRMVADIGRATALGEVTKLFIAMGVNDKGQTSAAVEAASNVVFDLARSLLPVTSISVLSPYDALAPSAPGTEFLDVKAGIWAALAGRGGFHGLDLESVAYTKAPADPVHADDAGAMTLAQAIAVAERAALAA